MGIQSIFFSVFQMPAAQRRCVSLCNVRWSSNWVNSSRVNEKRSFCVREAVQVPDFLGQGHIIDRLCGRKPNLFDKLAQIPLSHQTWWQRNWWIFMFFTANSAFDSTLWLKLIQLLSVTLFWILYSICHRSRDLRYPSKRWKGENWFSRSAQTAHNIVPGKNKRLTCRLMYT